MKIVIADDNPDILETTSMALEIDGHEVHVAPDTKRIIDKVEEVGADVLVQDIRMPDLDLAAHLDAIQARHPVPVIIFSAQEPDEEILTHPQVAGFLPKPFELTELREILAQAVPKA